MTNSPENKVDLKEVSIEILSEELEKASLEIEKEIEAIKPLPITQEVLDKEFDT